MTVIVDDDELTIYLVGTQGVPGPGVRYEHNQTVPSAMWTVNHNLGLRPQVSVLSSGGVSLLTEIVHTSLNQFLIYFDSPNIGQVICS